MLFLNNIIINFSFYNQDFYPLVILFLIPIGLFLYINLSKNILEELFKSDEQIQNSIKKTLHEINTPVSTIKLNTKILLKQTSDEKIKEKLNKINRSCEDLFELYHDMEYSIKKEVQNIQKEDIFLDELITKSINKFDDIKKDIKINYQKTNMIINIDKRGFSIVLDNLISNAIKYNKDNGKIDIYTKENTLYIKDTGIGIDMKNIFKIYDKYYQEDEQKDGFGIGLYTVKTFCDENNIKLNINSIQNTSTTISLTFN